jgi:hypothetical protein
VPPVENGAEHVASIHSLPSAAHAGSGMRNRATLAVIASATAFAFVSTAAISLHGDRWYPRSDDWSLVSLFTGNADAVAKVWEQHNEHRLPLPKLWMWAVFVLGGGDFRWGAAANTVIATLAAIAVLAAIRRVRGRFALTDAAIPLLVLNPGNNIHAWGFHAQYTSSLAVSLLLLAFLLRPPDASSPRLGWIGFGLGMAALPLCGLNGLVPATLLALALLVHPQPGRARAADGASRALRIGALAALTSTGVALISYEFPEHARAERSFEAVVLLTGRVLVSPLGTLPAWASWCALALLVVAAGAAFRPSAARTDREKTRQWLLLLFALAGLGLALSVGWGRSNRAWQNGMQAHFAALAVPLWCAVYAMHSSSEGATSRALRVALLVLVVGAFAHQTPRAYRFAEIVRARSEALRAAIDSGATAAEVANSHFSALSNVDTARMRATVPLGLQQLRDYGAEHYARLGATTEREATPRDLSPVPEPSPSRR